MSADLIEEARRSCLAELERPELARLGEALERLGVDDAETLGMVCNVTASPASQKPIERLLTRLSEAGVEHPGAAAERLLVIRTAVHKLPRVAALPVCASVKAMLCEEIRRWTIRDPSAATGFRVGTHGFADLCMLASLRRFPAGQFDWVRSGLPLSYLFGVRLFALPKVLLVTATQLRGRSPVFFSHYGYRRLGESLSEVEANRSYHRMACSMALQRDVKGLVASSWFRSPDTHRVSPHLAWVNTVMLENGGWVAVHGPADPDCGVFARSTTRRRLYESGAFTPTLGLVIWPRRAMIKWAESHPEFAD
jgi:hypothetical protein